MFYRDFRAMNTSILMAAEGSREAVDAGFDRAEAFVHSSECRFTRFSPDSELSQLNRSSGSWFEASPELFEVVLQAFEFHYQTGGLFDPGILGALQHAGYDRSMDDIKALGNLPAPSAPLQPQPRFSQIQLDTASHSIFLPFGLQIDLGGIAKGWIAEKAAQILSMSAEACAVDAGGDVSLIGHPSHTGSWRIALENPSDPNRALAIIKSGPGALATSTVSRRRWLQEGQVKHHLIDPRTQRPSDTEWTSVTVMASHLPQAEVYAKSILIGGPAEVKHLSGSNPEIEFIVVDQNIRLWGSKNSREYIDEQN
jgi:thiamine biosynthesis lipoprotein